MTLEGTGREDRNRLLVEWSTAVFAVFWSVWWAYAAESVLSRGGPLSLTREVALPRWVVGGITAVYVSLFTYFYVKWMWEARTFHWEIALRSFVQCLAPLVIVVTGLLLSSLHLYLQSELLLPQFVYGAILTIAWIVTTIITTLESERWI
jgi:hypothetical protein